MQIDATALDGVAILTPRVIADARGTFCEAWSRAALAALGIDTDWVQDNQSLSRAAGTVRGLHAQAPPHAQDKLVRVVHGAILDVAVDLRRGSPGFGRWTAAELSADNARQMLIPRGFLHGFVTRAPDTVVLYKVSAPYAPGSEIAVHFADPDLGIDWGIDPALAVLSDRDAAAPRLADRASPFACGG